MHKMKETASNENLEGKITQEGREQRSRKVLRESNAREGGPELQ